MKYTPNKWMIIKIRGGELYKVFGSWAGGYLDGDSWQLNSGIVKCTEDEDYYYFYGYSGSCYQCHKSCYGVAGMHNHGVLADFIKRAEGQIEAIEEDRAWVEFFDKELDK